MKISKTKELYIIEVWNKDKIISSEFAFTEKRANEIYFSKMDRVFANAPLFNVSITKIR